MIYNCEKCCFLFSRSGTVETCPDCGSRNVRPADEQEQDEYQKRLEHPEEF